jgi:hypothetical protein
MTDATDKKIQQVFKALDAMREDGRLGPHEPVSTEFMARVSRKIGKPVAEATFRRLEKRAIASAERSAREMLARLALQALAARQEEEEGEEA